MGVFIYDVAPNPANEAAREAAIVATGALSLADDPTLHEVVRATALAFGTQFASISIVYRDWQYLIAAHGLATGVSRRSSAFCAHAILQPDRAFVVADAREDERFAENPLVVDAPAIRFYAGAPLLHQPDVALGALCVFDSRPRPALDRQQEAALRREAERVCALIGIPPR